MTITEHDKLIAESNRLRLAIKVLQAKTDRLLFYAYISTSLYAFSLFVIYVRG